MQFREWEISGLYYLYEWVGFWRRRCSLWWECDWRDWSWFWRDDEQDPDFNDFERELNSNDDDDLIFEHVVTDDNDDPNFIASKNNLEDDILDDRYVREWIEVSLNTNDLGHVDETGNTSQAEGVWSEWIGISTFEDLVFGDSTNDKVGCKFR